MNQLLKTILVAFAIASLSNQCFSQCGYAPGLGCTGTNYNNFGTNSSTAGTLEYDNFVSVFHSTLVRSYDGSFKVWGEKMANNGTGNLTTLTDITKDNYPNLSGTPLKAALGGSSISGAQGILLTTDGLFAWGTTGTNGVLSNTISSTTFSKLTTGSMGNANSYGLPNISGGEDLRPAQVKMMFATKQTLAIVSCAGNVYVLSQTTQNRGGGSAATSATTWYQVKINATTNLTNVVAVRGTVGALIALTLNNELYTWGSQTYLGNNTAQGSTLNYATKMLTPTAEGANPIKMIGATYASASGNAGTTYYILYENGHLWALGRNSIKQLGNFGTAGSNEWVQPVYTNGGAKMTDIVWISPNEHEGSGNAAINVINSSSVIWNWGSDSGSMLGRTGDTGTSVGSPSVDPGQPSVPQTNVIAVETGGHTSMISRKCETKFGYVGHATNGSAGNSVSTNYPNYTFSTAEVQICGAVSAPVINVVGAPATGTHDKICENAAIRLEGTPAGGTFAITAGNGSFSNPGALTTNTLLTGTGNVTVSYTVNADGCGSTTVSRTFELEDCTPLITISGNVWNDANGSAYQDGGESGLQSGLWANMVDPGGKVISSVRVSENGAFSFSVSALTLTVTGDYKVILTNDGRIKNEELTSADTPTDGYGYTGTNRGTEESKDGANRTGVINIGDLSGKTASTTLEDVNFGLSNDPSILPVTFGPINASISSGILNINWTTLSERNNAYFEIEISADGKDFSKIGQVTSKAAGQESSSVLQYEFNKDIPATTALALGGGVLALGALAAGLRRRHKLLFMLAAAAVAAIVVAGCNKNDNSGWQDKDNLFVRIVQVDTDGAKSYSKVIKAVRN